METKQADKWSIYGTNRVFFPNGVHANSDLDDAWDAVIIADDANDEICAVYGDTRPEENERRARLMAAAPELLAACVELVGDIEAVGFDVVARKWPDVSVTYTRARAAIAKAEGGAA